MSAAFPSIFEALKAVPAAHVGELQVKTNTPVEYLLLGRLPSPFKQHAGKPMYFAQVRLGKAYVPYHLMPLYMHEGLVATISPELKKRMQGKTCFNFKTMPEAALLAELEELTAAGFRHFRKQGWV